MPIRGILLIMLIAIVYGVVFRNQMVSWWSSIKNKDKEDEDSTDCNEENQE